jgi:Zn-dependent protease with chaperone function
MESPEAVNLVRQAASAPYQRQRLICGVAGIGTLLLTLWLMLLLNLPHHLGNWFAPMHPILQGGLTLLLTAVLLSALQFPFDFFAGRVVEGNFRQINFTSGYQWGRAYVIHVVQWVGALTLAGAMTGWLYSLSPDRWFLFAPVLLIVLASASVCLPLPPGPKVALGTARRPFLERMRAELLKQKLPVPLMAFYEHGERSLAGSWAGAGPLRTLWLTRTLLDTDPRLAAALIAREYAHLRLGHRMLSLLATAVWTVAGFVLTALLLPPSWSTPAGVAFTAAAVMTTWSWVSLLFVFPALGRHQVLAADRGMLDAGFSLGEALAALDLLADRNRPDESLPPAIAFVFHPIPPMHARRLALLAHAGGTKN